MDYLFLGLLCLAALALVGDALIGAGLVYQKWVFARRADSVAT